MSDRASREVVGRGEWGVDVGCEGEDVGNRGCGNLLGVGLIGLMGRLARGKMASLWLVPFF